MPLLPGIAHCAVSMWDADCPLQTQTDHDRPILTITDTGYPWQTQDARDRHRLTMTDILSMTDTGCQWQTQTVCDKHTVHDRHRLVMTNTGTNCLWPPVRTPWNTDLIYGICRVLANTKSLRTFTDMIRTKKLDNGQKIFCGTLTPPSPPSLCTMIVHPRLDPHHPALPHSLSAVVLYIAHVWGRAMSSGAFRWFL